MSTPVVMLRHGAVDLALHRLDDGPGRPLLLVHGLGERSPASLPARYASWPGPVHALDLTGHGASTVPLGGGYTAEILMGDLDVAVGHLGEATLVGRGLGAYLALLLAGARPAEVRGAILCDGPGLAGGGPAPASPHVAALRVDGRDGRGDGGPPAPPDPWALAEMTRDPRPPDYAATFVRQAVTLSDLDDPVLVCAVGRPAWIEAALAEHGVRATGLDEALRAFASV